MTAEHTKADTALTAWPWLWGHLSEAYKGSLCALAGVPWLAARCKWADIAEHDRVKLVKRMRVAMRETAPAAGASATMQGVTA